MMNALWPRLRPAAPALALAFLALGVLFKAEIVAAVHVWNNSTAYGHCWLVLPIALFLAYERREQAAREPLAPQPMLALLALPVVVLWIAADLLGLMEGRQLALIGFVQVLLLAAFGPRLWHALAAGLIYLVFLVPFGAFLTPMLQVFTASFISHGLDMLHVPHNVAANQIEIPEGMFYVAEACAGLRFLIASIAFGVLYALTLFTSPWRRTVFIAAAAVIPVIANGFRALGIVLLGHVMGSADAAAADHLLYGWIFFSLVIAALAAAGLPFRQDAAPPRDPSTLVGGRPLRVLSASLAALLIAALGPIFAELLGGPGQARLGGPLFVPPAGCLERHDRAVQPLGQVFECGSVRIIGRLFLLPTGANPSAIMAVAQAQPATLLPGADLDEGRLQLDRPLAWQWVLARDERTSRAAIYTLFLNGGPALGGLKDRLRMAGNMLRHSGPAPAILAVAASGGDDAVGALSGFVEAQGDLPGRLAMLTAAP